MKKILLIMIMLAGSIGFAGREGNGGDGVLMNGQLYLLDFVEAGVEGKPFFDPNLSAYLEFTKGVTKAISQLPDAPVDLVARKLTEIYIVDPIAAKILLRAMEFYSWRAVLPELFPIDIEDAVVKIPKEMIVHLATRKLQAITINRGKWQMLSSEHKAGLIFHEAIYSIAPTGQNCEQSSLKTRLLTGHLFLGPVTKETIENMRFFPPRIDGAPLLWFWEGENGFAAVRKENFFLVGTYKRFFFNLKDPQLEEKIINACEALGDQEAFAFYPILTSVGTEITMTYFSNESEGCYSSGLNLRSTNLNPAQPNFEVISSLQIKGYASLNKCVQSVKEGIKHLHDNPFSL